MRYQLLPLLLMMLIATPGAAHTRSESFSQWSWQGEQLHYSFSVLAREVTRLGPAADGAGDLPAQLARHLDRSLTVSTAHGLCQRAAPSTPLPSRGGYIQVEGKFQCAAVPRKLHIGAFFDVVATHTHYARLRRAETVHELVYTRDQRQLALPTTSDPTPRSRSQASSFSQFIWIGAEHVLSGLDHLVFILALVMLARGAVEMLWLISGFTVGHSFSLALATLGLAQPHGTVVEALIGFSIGLVAAECWVQSRGNNLQISRWLLTLCLLFSGLIAARSGAFSPPLIAVISAGIFGFCHLRLSAANTGQRALRLTVTALFGVVHGFGFAGGLLDMAYSTQSILTVLLGFNLGVELGQLAVLGVLLLLGVNAQRLLSPHSRALASNAVLSLLVALGTFWFVGRLVLPTS